MTRVSVVILNYNGNEYLEQFLPSVVKHSPNANIVVIDNGSTDQSIPFLEKNYPEIELIVLPENLGYAGGYNEGLKSITTEYSILLNSDIEVTSGWIEPMLNIMEDDNTIAACQPKILSYNQQDHFEYAGASGGYIDWLGYPFCRGRIFDTLEQDSGQYNDKREVFWASGACLFVRTPLFKELGGFDSDFFAHMEEIDLCWRLRKKGHKVMVCPESTIYHLGGGTLSSVSPRKTYLNFRNSLEMLTKNSSELSLLLKLPLRWLLDWAALVKFLIDGSPTHGLAVLNAHLSYLRNFRRTLGKRSSNRFQKDHLIHPNLIVFEYFLKGKKHFDQLGLE